MNGYERMIKIIREESKKTGRIGYVRLATMTSPTTCDIGGVDIDENDYMITERLAGKLEAGDTVLIAQVAGDRYAIIERMVTADVSI